MMTPLKPPTFFLNILKEYSFYWLIVDAGLPENISEICSKNRNLSDCAIYYDNVIPERIWISQIDSLRSLILTSFTCWLGGASDLIGRRKILLLNFCGCFISFFMAGILIYCDIHPIYLLLCSTVYDLTGGLTGKFKAYLSLNLSLN